jgi:heme-degrading monooxygenase HmoA
VAAQTEAFLETFLPKMWQFPGVRAIYNYARPDQGDDYTVVIWENEAALKQYRKSMLIKEAIAFEKKTHLPETREGYPILIAL